MSAFLGKWWHTGFKGSRLAVSIQYLGAGGTGYMLAPPSPTSSLFEIVFVGAEPILVDVRNYHPSVGELRQVGHDFAILATGAIVAHRPFCSWSNLSVPFVSGYDPAQLREIAEAHDLLVTFEPSWRKSRPSSLSRRSSRGSANAHD
ncbi:hypothetical protein [Bradyrhizobium sp. Ec3.3]|uniref:hypothetical protein n=1 Tax=Bradyrhizobium sp. Ec3.3 TaxID=189753 RepID=UPI0012EC1967|nr:hypothetical protein [Bradyrhizobium sp. Ec3.3]